jgi:lysophospholipid acyltransferase (LPLAT)-like uncharacterized protein
MRSLLKRIDPYLPRLLSYPVWLLLYLISATQKHVVLGPDCPTLVRKRQGVYLLAFWHSRILLPLYQFQHCGIGALISQSRDGEFITRTAQRFGYIIYRGSASRRGAGGLMGLIHHLRSGRSIIITPDGPRGPREVVQPGVMHLAKHSGYPITPVCFSCTHNLRLKSWDRFMVPLPFGTLYTILGKPIAVGPDDSDEELERKRQLVQAEIRRIARIVDELTGSCLPPEA